MTDPSIQDVNNETINKDPATQEALVELRSLLFGVEQSEVGKLQERLKNPNISAEDISELLPEAIAIDSIKDKRLGEAIAPAVETAIQVSVKRDLNVIAEAIFPVIGPAIRKAIATALEATIQSLNQMLDYSVSPQGLLWRIEALQTGKSFAEVVLLRTLIYRIEQIFLIHKQTGLLLQHIVADGVNAMDADLVSAMLTAIQSFVQDSFNVPNNDTLETLQYGELTIWIEEGPQAILAGVIRGNAPKELRFLFQSTIEKIHLHQGKALQNFQGDTTPFEASQLYLEACKQAQYQPRKHKVSPILLILLGGILVGLGTWGWFEFSANRRWNAYLEKLQAEPGIAIAQAEKRYGKYFISGLRDPLAADPIKIMKQTKINSASVVSQWKPYLSLESEMIAARAKKLLQPPKTVSLSVDQNGILDISGTAPHRWVVETRRLARTIPGVTKFLEKNLRETEEKKLEIGKKKLETQVILFARGSQQLAPNQEQKLQNLTREIQTIIYSAQMLGKKVRIQIIGRTDTEGTAVTNRIVSQARANAIASILISQGVESNNLDPVGVGTKQPLHQELSATDKAFNRSVSFKVVVTDTSN